MCLDRTDRDLTKALWDNRNSGGFENALAKVQTAFTTDPEKYGDQLKRLQGASVLQGMNEAFFAGPTMEFQLRTFLVSFDAIFTLNQDVLLEHHYFRHVELVGAQKWRGAQLPGMRRIPNHEFIHDSSWGKDSWVPVHPAQFRIENGLQPCFKLHGSSNWRDAEGGQLLVIGGNKSRTIRSHAVLAWSFDSFREYLAGPKAKLFVIGYGFRDSHLNKAIIEAVEHRSLQFFVIDRWGSDVVRRANPAVRSMRQMLWMTRLGKGSLARRSGAWRKRLGKIWSHTQTSCSFSFDMDRSLCARVIPLMALRVVNRSD
jgi:hypothetical protein